ncbi:MAG: molybdopterin-dependent oxidoreductase [Gammaproteobacteria bacterium]|nr:molybdopterin-dependent oxidoreductase [Gammaproteobacteria bacterium]
MGLKRSDRREFLKRGAALAGGLGVAAVKPAMGQTPGNILGTDELVGYGKRSRFVKSVRIPHGGRPSPDAFGLDFHIAAPLQDSVGVITPSSLHYMGTTRGSFVPDINPAEHRLMIHGMVDRPLIFTMDELKRLPSVTRLHFIECAGNRSSSRKTTVQETHGMTSCAEWTGVLLSTLLKEAGVQDGGSWIVAEGVEEVKGASSIPMAKAMEDCLLCYGMNGEAVRPQQGFPLRLLVPGFEGILSVKWLRRIKVVDRFYMTYNDYGNLSQDADDAALKMQIGPKSVITYPSGGQQLPGRGFYQISGLAWSGGGAVSRVEISTDGGRSWTDADIRGTAHPMAHTRFSYNWNWDGSECELQSRCTDELGSIQSSRAQIAEFWNVPPGQPFRVRGHDNSIQPWRIDRDGSVHNAIS